jgi:non-ribosomal peptide synthase protein (TIGR01720 family)
LSRTIGWFTATYPLLVEAPGDLAEKNGWIEAAARSLRAVPEKGIGYGILVELGGAAELRVTPQVSFNYLGSYDLRQDGFFRTKWGGDGASSEASGQVLHDLTFNAITMDGALRAVLAYNLGKFSIDEAEGVMGYLKEALTDLVSAREQKASSPESSVGPAVCPG